jgi:hypothetical protein
LISLWRDFDALIGGLSARWPAEFSDDLFTWPRYLWAFEVFYSRCFSVQMTSDGATVPSLVPIIDLLNHDPHAAVDYATDPLSQKFGLISRASISAGACVNNNYGARSNEELLVSYAFCLPVNTQDSVSLRLGVKRDDLLSHKRALLRRYASHGWQLTQRVGVDGALSASLLWTMRVLVMSRRDLYRWCGKDLMTFLDVTVQSQE